MQFYETSSLWISPLAKDPMNCSRIEECVHGMGRVTSIIYQDIPKHTEIILKWDTCSKWNPKDG